MSTQHGTRHRYINGCRCDECKAANSDYERDRRQRHANGEVVSQRAVVMALSGEPAAPAGPGRVESAVQVELAGLSAAAEQPGLAEVALAMGRLLDSRAQTAKPSAARQLMAAMDTLHAASVRSRRGGLRAVREMTGPKGGA